MYKNSDEPSLALLKGDESKTPKGTKERTHYKVFLPFFYCCYDKHNKSLRGQGLFWLTVTACGLSWRGVIAAGQEAVGHVASTAGTV